MAGRPPKRLKIENVPAQEPEEEIEDEESDVEVNLGDLNEDIVRKVLGKCPLATREAMRTTTQKWMNVVDSTGLHLAALTILLNERGVRIKAKLIGSTNEESELMFTRFMSLEVKFKVAFQALADLMKRTKKIDYLDIKSSITETRIPEWPPAWTKHITALNALEQPMKVQTMRLRCSIIVAQLLVTYFTPAGKRIIDIVFDTADPSSPRAPIVLSPDDPVPDHLKRHPIIRCRHFRLNEGPDFFSFFPRDVTCSFAIERDKMELLMTEMFNSPLFCRLQFRFSSSDLRRILRIVPPFKEGKEENPDRKAWYLKGPVSDLIIKQVVGFYYDDRVTEISTHPKVFESSD